MACAGFSSWSLFALSAKDADLFPRALLLFPESLQSGFPNHTGPVTNGLHDGKSVLSSHSLDLQNHTLLVLLLPQWPIFLNVLPFLILQHFGIQ